MSLCQLMTRGTERGQQRAGEVRHRIGRKLQVHEVERLREVAAQHVPRHRRANRSAREIEPGPGLDRVARQLGIRRAAAGRHDVREVRLAFEPVRQLEHVALEPAEVVVGIAAECNDADHGA